MSETTNIKWATSTGNPWIGCTKVSPGCKNCYAAELDANRFSRTMGGGTPENPVSHWGKGAPRFKTKGFWKDAVKWNLEAGKASIGVREARRMLDNDEVAPASLAEYQDAANYHRPRIFPSLCDWLDDEVPIEWLADFLKLIHDTPNLDWLLLSKRPENFLSRIYAAKIHIEMQGIEKIEAQELLRFVFGWFNGVRIPENVWLGVSVEDKKRADERIPLLLQIPAKVRFLSVEPLLGPVDLNRICLKNDFCDQCGDQITNSCLDQTAHCSCCVEGDEAVIFGPIDWVIVGGESGKDRRDCGVEAIVGVARQCQAADVPCFVKQDSAFKPGQKGGIDDTTWDLKQFPLSD